MIYQNPEYYQKYLFLIEQLLRSPQGQYQSILDGNSELIDTEFIEMMRQRAEAEKNMGNIQNAELLNSIADRLNENLPSSFSSNLDREKKQNLESSSSDNFNQPKTQQKIPELPEAQQIVLVDIFKNIEKHGTNREIIYPILQKHLPQLNLEFADNLRRWATIGLSQISTQYAQNLALSLVNLSGLMLYFPFGDRGTNIAISRAGFESSLTFFTREKFPEAYAELMINLGIAVEEDLLADSVEKWEEAIACYEKASEIFTREVNPERWAFIQENLGNAYRNRKQGEPEINLQQSITFYQNALQVFTVEKNREKWGLTQNNLGSSYLQLSMVNLKESREDKEQLIESSIECYEKALQVFKKDPYPDNLAFVQNSLGQAYTVRLQGNYNDNHKKAQQYFENALSVYTPTSNPYYYQQVKVNQQKLQELREAVSYIDSPMENKEDFSFIIELLKLTLASQGDAQKVFAFLEKI
ncbi:lipopolysaccharide assembly protein LapB [Okeania sp. KiyG1]|uniref:tetratricopeptide repeat protein n=1 Tax=Okeania sp. KiyG1 TaxID=2720165 RepID=UPI0019245DBA|nr:hypothetical protein [Okeania sp. KiyG1]GGA12893.1 hypothetical protein CYANOKiyG1_26110 [Okeania sp. KiyG1]